MYHTLESRLSAAEPSDGALSRESRQLDIDGAFSGYGHETYCPEGIPVEQAIFGILAAFAVSFGFLFRAVTQITGGRRRKRSADGDTLAAEEPVTWYEELQTKVADMYWWGR